MGEKESYIIHKAEETWLPISANKAADWKIPPSHHFYPTNQEILCVKVISNTSIDCLWLENTVKNTTLLHFSLPPSPAPLPSPAQLSSSSSTLSLQCSFSVFSSSDLNRHASHTLRSHFFFCFDPSVLTLQFLQVTTDCKQFTESTLAVILSKTWWKLKGKNIKWVIEPFHKPIEICSVKKLPFTFPGVQNTFPGVQNRSPRRIEFPTLHNMERQKWKDNGESAV